MTALEKIRKLLEEKQADGILLRKRNNFSWLTNGRRNDIVQSTELGVADVIVLTDNILFITSEMERRRILEEELAHVSFAFELICEDWMNGTEHLIMQAAEGKKMLTDTAFADFLNVENKLREIRSILSEEEVSRYRNLCQVAAQAVEQTCKEIEPGMNEYEIAALLSQKVIAKGAKPTVVLVATDDRIYHYRHPIPTSKKLDKHAMIVLCAEEAGLVANCTRFVYFGELPSELAANKEKLARIDAAMNHATRPGAVIGEIVQAGIEQYAKEGFPNDWKLLHQGGLSGYESREYLATPKSEGIVHVNQAFAWNPMLPGVKSEDTILVKETGIEFMTHTGEWVYQDVSIDGVMYKRPDILLRETR
jgi:Xaa-Pro dipeptidase